MERFYWLVDGVLAGCSRPGGTQHGERAMPRGEVDGILEHDLADLRNRGIGAVLSLTETAIDARAVAESGLAWLHIPVPDLHAPSPEQFLYALAFIDRQRAFGRPVAVHCLMGQGRTGSILAAYLIRDGASATAAIKRLRELCPGAISAEEQTRALERFALRRDWFV